jgi:hypothetical protein
MATNKNFEVKNGLSVGGTERISSAGAFSGSLASGVTATTQSALDNSTKISTTAYTDAAITALIGGAPGTLDTLNELAAAIADDENYSTTLTTALATKLPLAGGTLTGGLTIAGGSTGADLYINNTSPTLGFTDSNSFSDNNDIYIVRGTSTGKLQFQFFDHSANTTTQTFLIDQTGNATFDGDLTIGSGGVDISGTDQLRYRMLNNGTFKGGIEVATTNGDMITTSVVDDLAIRSQANILFSGGGNTESLRLNSTGGIISRSTGANYSTGTVAGLFVDATGRGTVRIRSEADSAAELFFDVNGGASWDISARMSSDNYDLHFYNRDLTTDTLTGVAGPNVVFTQTGRVGIGAVPPDSKLEVKGSGGGTGLTFKTTDASDNETFYIMDGGRSGNRYYPFTVGIPSGTTPATSAVFQVEEAGMLTVLTNGNVGVGTTAPDARLHVYNNSANSYSTSIRLGQSYNTAYSQISSNFGGSMTINAGQGAGTPIMHLQVNGAEKARLSGTTTGRLYVSGTSRGRIVTQNEISGDGDDCCGAILEHDYSSWSTIFSESWLGGNTGWGTFWAGSSGAAYRRDAADTNPNEYVFVGSGQKRYTFELNAGGALTSDGPITGNYYDYAEYFEWEDGNPDNEDRRGFTVVLTESGLIRKATSDDDAEEIMGAISGTSGVVGDAAAYDWNGKYEIDEWGTRILDDVVTVSWTVTDENGEQTNHSYLETEIPENITVPDNAGRREHKEYRLTADYDPSHVYVPRDKRPEWGIVGLLGKVRIRDESPKNPRWKYIKTIASKKLWLIR